jgi:hypothetical protein
MRKSKKALWLCSPIHVASHGQWWSIFSTQRRHDEQWCALSGFRAWHFLQKRSSPFDLTVNDVVGGGAVVGNVLYPLSFVVLPGGVNTAVV